jgi:hypothetical protein
LRPIRARQGLHAASNFRQFFFQSNSESGLTACRNGSKTSNSDTSSNGKKRGVCDLSGHARDSTQQATSGNFFFQSNSESGLTACRNGSKTSNSDTSSNGKKRGVCDLSGHARDSTQQATSGNFFFFQSNSESGLTAPGTAAKPATATRAATVKSEEFATYQGTPGTPRSKQLPAIFFFSKQQ